MAYYTMVATATGGTDLLSEVGKALTEVIGWVGEFTQSMIGGELSALLPLIAVSCGISALFVGVKVVKGLIWGA